MTLLISLFRNPLFGVAIAQEEECSFAIQKAGGLIPGLLGPHVKVFLGKTLNPALPLMSQLDR